MEHKYKVGDILYFENNNQKVKCEILELFHLIYKSKYPTYKIKLLEDYYEDIDWEFRKYQIKQETMIVAENMLSEN